MCTGRRVCEVDGMNTARAVRYVANPKTVSCTHFALSGPNCLRTVGITNVLEKGARGDTKGTCVVPLREISASAVNV